ncbi:MAG: hypothetical protein U1E97_08450 [Alphaproteobacteria bacterium]
MTILIMSGSEHGIRKAPEPAPATTRSRGPCRRRPAWIAAHILALAAAGGGHADADEKTQRPGTIGGSLSVELHQDWNTRSENRSNETSQTYLKVEPEIEFRITEQVSAHVHGVLTPVRDAKPGEDRFFEDHGLYAEEAYMRFVEDDLTLLAGKFTPRFGMAWSDAPGIWGRDVAERNYKFIERVGLGGAHELDLKEHGVHTISASTFFLDTSPAYQSLGRARAPATRGRADGGVSNTGRLNSFAIAYDVEKIEALPGLKAHAGYIDLARGRDGTADQRGGVMGALYELPLNDALVWVPLAEYALFRNVDGAAGQDRGIATVSSNIILRDTWNLALVASRTATDQPGAGQSRDHQFQATIGYRPFMGLLIEAGWLTEEVNDILTRRAGAMITYKRAF